MQPSSGGSGGPRAGADRVRHCLGIGKMRSAMRLHFSVNCSVARVTSDRHVKLHDPYN
jgi:hypothetical protein